MTIRDNRSKLQQLNFNQQFDMKTVSLYQGVKLTILNPKKAKKK